MNMNKKIIAAIGLTGVMLPFCMGCGEKTTATINLSQDKITIDGTGATSDGNIVTITAGGNYKISGTLSEGQIKVDTENESDKVELILDGVNLTNTTESAIYEKQAGQVTITLAKGSENTVSSGEESMYEEALEAAKASASNTEDATAATTETTQQVATTTKAAIYVKNALTLSGEGSLEVNGYMNNGIQAKEDLKIKSGTITVTASNDGIKGGADVTIANGTITTTTVGDGISAGENLTVADGTFCIKTGEGAGEVKSMGGAMPANMTEKKNGDAASDTEQSTEEKKESTDETTGKTAETDTGKATEENTEEKKESTDETTDKTAETDTEKSEDGATDTKETEKQAQNRRNPGQMAEFFQQDSSQESTSGDSQKGLKCELTLTLDGGTFTFDTADDAIHSNDGMIINDGKIEIATGDDGIHAENALIINDGSINITQSYEGIEATELVINDGDIDVVASDDGLNAGGGSSDFGMGAFFGGRGNTDSNTATEETAASKTTDSKTTDTETKDSETTDTETTEESVDPSITINGGDLYVNAGGDGIDSNENITITGGNVYVDGSANGGNSAIDIGTENNGICQITGGTVVAVGYSTMAEAIDTSSTQYSFMYVFDSTVSEGTEITIADADGKELATVTTVKDCDSIIYSSKELSKGEIYTITAGEQSGEITLEESYTTNSTSTGMFGGRGGHMKPNGTGDDTTDGETQDGEMPEMPDGEMPSGEMPEMPDGERPQMPDGEMPNGERPQMPNEEGTDGKTSEKNTSDSESA